MIQPEYQFYLKTADGHRGAMLTDVMSFEATFRWNEITKWTMTGAGLTPCPIGKGAEIIVYRAEAPFLSGYITDIEDSYDTMTGIYDWRVEGCDDLGKLGWRVIYPNPANADVQPTTEYSAEGYTMDLLLELIKRNGSDEADLEDRRITTLTTAAQEHLGETIAITADYDDLQKFTLDQLMDGALGIRSVWDGQTGVSEIQLYLPNDVSQTVVFSVEAGSLAGWTRKRKAPKGNVILVTGTEILNSEGEGTGRYQTVIVSDTDSVARWGRIELKISHDDIRPAEGETWASCAERLRQAALNDLIENSAQDGYQLSIVELDRMAYKTHWDLGDIVSIRIADTEFTAPIEEIKVSYSGGIEQVTPSVGELEKGELQAIFDDIWTLTQQVTMLYKKSKKNT